METSQLSPGDSLLMPLNAARCVASTSTACGSDEWHLATLRLLIDIKRLGNAPIVSGTGAQHTGLARRAAAAVALLHNASMHNTCLAAVHAIGSPPKLRILKHRSTIRKHSSPPFEEVHPHGLRSRCVQAAVGMRWMLLWLHGSRLPPWAISTTMPHTRSRSASP